MQTHCVAIVDFRNFTVRILKSRISRGVATDYVKCFAHQIPAETSFRVAIVVPTEVAEAGEVGRLFES